MTENTATHSSTHLDSHYTFSDGYVGSHHPLKVMIWDVSYTPWMVRLFDDIYAAILLDFLYRWDGEYAQEKPYDYEDKALLAMLGWKQEHLEHAIQVLTDKGVLWCKQGNKDGNRLYWPHGGDIDRLADARLTLENREGGHGA